jgi:hypothetical protein
VFGYDDASHLHENLFYIVKYLTTVHQSPNHRLITRGMWLSGRAPALHLRIKHAGGPGFDHLPVHSFYFWPITSPTPSCLV